jgi:hypothetical protein
MRMTTGASPSCCASVAALDAGGVKQQKQPVCDGHELDHLSVMN